MDIIIVFFSDSDTFSIKRSSSINYNGGITTGLYFFIICAVPLEIGLKGVVVP